MQAHPLSIPAARILPANLKASKNARRSNAFPLPSQPHPAQSAPLLPAASSTTIPVLPLQMAVAQAAGLAHDAGNLLGALGLYCDLLRVPGVLRPEHLHYATELSLISSRSTELIRRLLAPTAQDLQAPLATSRLDASTLQPAAVRRRIASQPETARPGLMHASVLRNLAPVLERIAAGSAHVLVTSPATLPDLDLPAETLERITVNLVRNAAEAIRLKRAAQVDPAAGQIRVTLAIAANRLQLTVEDNGPGLSQAAAHSFMHPAELPPHSPNGHGHRIIHELVTSSGGQLSIRIRPGLGTTFCLKWPLRSPHAAPFTAAFDTTFDTAFETVSTPSQLPTVPPANGISLAPPTTSVQEGSTAC